jgi:hypothetical protein
LLVLRRLIRHGYLRRLFVVKAGPCLTILPDFDCDFTESLEVNGDGIVKYHSIDFIPVLAASRALSSQNIVLHQSIVY